MSGVRSHGVPSPNVLCFRYVGGVLWVRFETVVPGVPVGHLRGCNGDSKYEVIHQIARALELDVCNGGGCHHQDDSGEYQMIAGPSGSPPSQLWHVGVRRLKDVLELKSHVLVNSIVWPMVSFSVTTLG